MKSQKITKKGDLEIGKCYRDGDSFYYVTGRVECYERSFLEAISFDFDEMEVDLSTPYIEDIVEEGDFEEISLKMFLDSFKTFKKEKEEYLLLETDTLALADLELRKIPNQ
ncbi:hypothetical protein OKE68_04475 [Riemerella anatipestifer]|uniref:Uncharacterized protein n=1 Tax=Riemerella anatipestifer TaxID=34085 RepID=A0AAP3ETT8_RIEAN|nr:MULTISPECIES: hypothetical protein [Weeksellaceae]AZZ59183.1 hypothetical protein AWB57_09200 [Riemerella anatipestifer]MBT0573760.1 hypothetical protein [Riemerella anatipestifer]MCU7568029.1 hypothetical protein [Riemerella anatipestifer]MCW0490050.1 hypothetical protein [Riemerella anatipestifer]MCW0510677.1 hypothetical protein [Riemerella anatipestifer]